MTVLHALRNTCIENSRRTFESLKLQSVNVGGSNVKNHLQMQYVYLGVGHGFIANAYVASRESIVVFRFSQYFYH